MRKTTLLSTHLGVSRVDFEKKGVFDAVLGIDTKLFVDPKLLTQSEIAEFENVNDTIYGYFRKLLKLHKQSAASPRLRVFVRDMLAVPEPVGVSIGYGDESDKGTSISKSVATKILISASEILAIGIDDEEILEVLGLFVDGYGADSISDLIIQIAYGHFCHYTQRVSLELGIKTKEYEIDDITYNLPEHPFNKTHIIFIPHTFLCQLPIASNWSGVIAAAKKNEQLRSILNKTTVRVFKEIFDDLKESDEKKELAKKRFSDLLKVYTGLEPDIYKLKTDASGYYGLMPFVEEESSNIRCPKKPKSAYDLITSVRLLIKQYLRAIEENGGNKLLYRKTETGVTIDDRTHREDVAQILFYLIADVFCAEASIFLSRESDAGKGPVDFSLGTGYKEKVLVEIKKSTNPKLIPGYKKQTVAYKKSEKAAHCFYVVIDVEKKKPGRAKTSVEKLLEYVESNKIDGVEVMIIDGLIYPSPSKL